MWQQFSKQLIEVLRLGVLRYPKSYSLSKLMHEAAMKQLGISGQYDIVALAPDDLSTYFPKFPKVYQGMNITMPHKEAVAKLCTELSAEAEAIGAVNTVCFQITANSTVNIRGHNTDIAGFSHALEAVLGCPIEGKTILLLGAGGSARAVLYALARQGAKRVIIWTRNESKALELVREISSCLWASRIELCTWNESSAREDISLLVNCTPIGMMDENLSQELESVLTRVGSGYSFFDLVYKADLSRTFLQSALDGYYAHSCDGIPMLVEQARQAFNIWTGEQIPFSVMRSALSGY